MTYAELFRRRQELVGRSVDTIGKVFFLTRCPPEGGSSDCTLTGFLTDPSRADFLESDRDRGLPLAERGRLLSCPESQSVDRACPGWRQGQRYRLVVRVERQVLGGRATDYVQLEVTTKQMQ